MKAIDTTVLLSAVSMTFILFAVLAIGDKKTEELVPEPIKATASLSPFETLDELRQLINKRRSAHKRTEELTSTFEEEPSEELNCLFYATVPIGRYYITAYNHKETGSKKTASGATCHEGTITTCAADPKYHKFGEYLEIDGRIYRVEDTGSAVKKKHIDLYFQNYSQMARYGSNYQNISRVEFPFGKPKDT